MEARDIAGAVRALHRQRIARTARRADRNDTADRGAFHVDLIVICRTSLTANNDSRNRYGTEINRVPRGTAACISTKDIARNIRLDRNGIRISSPAARRTAVHIGSDRAARQLHGIRRCRARAGILSAKDIAADRTALNLDLVPRYRTRAIAQTAGDTVRRRTACHLDLIVRDSARTARTTGCDALGGCIGKCHIVVRGTARSCRAAVYIGEARTATAHNGTVLDGIARTVRDTAIAVAADRAARDRQCVVLHGAGRSTLNLGTCRSARHPAARNRCLVIDGTARAASCDACAAHIGHRRLCKAGFIPLGIARHRLPADNIIGGDGTADCCRIVLRRTRTIRNAAIDAAKGSARAADNGVVVRSLARRSGITDQSACNKGT